MNWIEAFARLHTHTANTTLNYTKHTHTHHFHLTDLSVFTNDRECSHNLVVHYLLFSKRRRRQRQQQRRQTNALVSTTIVILSLLLLLDCIYVLLLLLLLLFFVHLRLQCFSHAYWSRRFVHSVVFNHFKFFFAISWLLLLSLSVLLLSDWLWCCCVCLAIAHIFSCFLTIYQVSKRIKCNRINTMW